MKVVHVSHAFPPFSRAGCENYCFNLAREESHRHEVSVFHRISDASRPEYEVSEDRVEGLPVVRLNRTFNDMKSFAETYRCEPASAAFGAHLDRVRPDVVHFHHVTCLSTDCVHEAKKRGIAVVYTLHDYWLLCPLGQLLRRDLSVCDRHSDADCVNCKAYQLRLSGGQAQVRALWRRAAWLKQFRLPVELYRRLASRPFRNEDAAIAQIQERTASVREMCGAVDRFIAPSRFLRQRYIEFGIPAERIAYHDYGFDRSCWPAAGPRVRKPGPLRAVYLGTWIPPKGLHVLVEAFRALDPDRAELTIHGYGVNYEGSDDYEPNLRRLAAEAPNIRFGSSYTPEDVPRLLADADVLVVPSIWYENSPLTIHEAFLAGVPVVTSDLGGMRELVEDGVSGLTFRAGNAASLRDALKRLLADPALLERLRQNLPAVKTIAENAAELNSIYEEVAAMATPSTSVGDMGAAVQVVTGEGEMGSRDVAGQAGYRSRFGGLWIDLDNADAVLDGKVELGLVTAEQALQIRSFIANGYVTLPNAVAPELVERLKDDIEEAWSERNPGVHVEYWLKGVMHIEPARPEIRDLPHKMLDLHAFYASAREVVLARPIVEFLNLLFERPALAFQSLYFATGTQQPIHQDTAYVVVDSPLEFAASWIALEDIHPNSGELEYYQGSHRLADYPFAGGRKNMQAAASDPEHMSYLESLHQRSQAAGFERLKFRPRRGDALIWHADLAHGGSGEISPSASRRSIVTHYCPANLSPGYFAHSRHSGRLRHAPGCYFCYHDRLA